MRDQAGPCFYQLQCLENGEYVPECVLPRVGMLVVRTDHLTEFEARSQDNRPSPAPEVSTSLMTKSRNTALCIMAALAAMNRTDLQEPYKAGEVISNKLAEMSIELGGRAIAEWLKEVPAALNSRKH